MPIIITEMSSQALQYLLDDIEEIEVNVKQLIIACFLAVYSTHDQTFMDHSKYLKYSKGLDGPHCTNFTMQSISFYTVPLLYLYKTPIVILVR